jgi:hypothetical protein
LTFIPPFIPPTLVNLSDEKGGTCDSANGFAAGRIGDVNKGIVVGCKDVADPLVLFIVAQLGPEVTVFVFAVLSEDLSFGFGRLSEKFSFARIWK